MKTWSSVLVSLLLLASGCTQPPPQPEFTADDDAAIRDLVEQWRGNLLEGRAMANVDLYADDAAELLANPAVGKDAIRARWEGFVDRYEYTEVSTAVREIIGIGDFAYVWVEADMKYRLDGNPRIQDATWTLLLRRGAEGDWKVQRTSWMSSARPDSAAMEAPTEAGG